MLHAYAILLAQDCDLLRDYEARAKNPPDRVLNSILFFEALPADQAKAKVGGRDIFRRIERHGEERYHLLAPVDAANDRLNKGIPELVIDFRRYFSMAAVEVYRQCALLEDTGAKRRCRLISPYREHLQTRAAFYFQRVGLPDQPAAAVVAIAAREGR